MTDDDYGVDNYHNFIHCFVRQCMSLSSLPDIFRQTHTAGGTVQRRQGASFLLHLNGSLCQPQVAPRSGSSLTARQYSTLQSNKQRSASSSMMRPKHSHLSEDNTRTNLTERNKNQLNFKHGGQMMGSSAAKKNSGMAVISISNVCYETSRRFSNRMVDLEQADSLKNNIESNLKNMGIAALQMEDIRQSSRQIQSTFRSYITTAVDDMSYFQAEFASALQICYNNLSKLRRQTNDELRANSKELEKVSNQFIVCKSIMHDLVSKGGQIASETIQVEKEPLKSVRQEGIDFGEISEIPRTSRGGTGSGSKRTRMVELPNHNGKARKSADWDLCEQQQLKGIGLD